jgi:hypothetical protein
VLIAMFIGQPQFVFNEMQINEYDITNELGEREYRFDGQKPLIFNNNTIFESLLKHSKSLKLLGLRGLCPPGPSTTALSWTHWGP